MDWQDRLSNLGGGLGAITAYILKISLFHIFEVAIFALVGSVIGEGVKELVKFVKKKQGTDGK